MTGSNSIYTVNKHESGGETKSSGLNGSQKNRVKLHEKRGETMCQTQQEVVTGKICSQMSMIHTR